MGVGAAWVAAGAATSCSELKRLMKSQEPDQLMSQDQVGVDIYSTILRPCMLGMPAELDRDREYTS